jgi:hypothetical protein
MNFPGFVLAYHGCDRAVGERILAGRAQVQPSANEYDWLGSGAYFWENSPRRAMEWAEFQRDHPAVSRARIKSPFIVGAIIQPGWTLDLTESNCLWILRNAYDDFVISIADSHTDLPANAPGFVHDEDFVKRTLDCAVINYLHLIRFHQQLPPFACVRGAFFEGVPLYPGAGIASRARIQWCVRDSAQTIRGYFRPLPGWEE